MSDGMRVEEQLAAAGLDAVTATRLAAAVAADGPSVLPGREADPLLAAAVIAARDPHLVRHALPALLGVLDRHAAVRGVFVEAVLWHLRGLVAWRVDRDVPGASLAVARSLELLDPTDERAVVYVGRVLDTSGQLLHHQGLLADAREEFERALASKEAAGDEAGAALTLGNLGRLCMELGDFEAATAYLGRDLDHVARTAPEHTRLRGQLLTQLAACHLELGRLDEVDRLLAESERLTGGDDDPIGRTFVAVQRGRLALRRGDAPAASRHAADARAALTGLPDAARFDLGGLVAFLDAEVHAAGGDPDRALLSFAEADEAWREASRVSPLERAELLEAWAEVQAAAGRPREAATCLRRALRHLDATTADGMRTRLDVRLRALDEPTWLLHSTGRFVGHGQIELLLDEAGQAGFRGREERLAVLFSDIRRFTSISERLAPDVLIALLNRYLEAMTRCVELQEGMVDKFIGDAVMALFSLPETHADDADRAVAAALHMQAELARFNRSLPDRVPPFEAGIGLHAGSVVAGLIGSPQKRSYTVIGDAVNTASRVEGMTKALGVPVLVTAELVTSLARPDAWLLVPYGTFRPKGRAGAVEVFHLAGPADGSERASHTLERVEAATTALALLHGREFRAAQNALETLAHEAPDGRGFAMLAARAAACAEDPPDDDWDGSIELTEK